MQHFDKVPEKFLEDLRPPQQQQQQQQVKTWIRVEINRFSFKLVLQSILF